jgi:hypothetical protein
MSEKDTAAEETLSRKEHEKMVRLLLDGVWGYVRGFGRAIDFIGRNFGDEALRRFFAEYGEERARPGLENIAEVGALRFMNGMCRHMNLIGGDFTLREDDREIVIQGRCPSGGRYIREASKDADKDGVPYYCVHCGIWWKELPARLGVPLTFDRDPNGLTCAWRYVKTGKV